MIHIKTKAIFYASFLTATLFFVPSSFAVSDPVLCSKIFNGPNELSKLFNEPQKLSKSDLRYLQRSRIKPVATGGTYPNKEFLDFHGEDFKPKEKVNRWSVYFVGNENKTSFDLPSQAIKGLQERLDSMAKRSMELFELWTPLQIFFISESVQFAYPNKLGGWRGFWLDSVVGQTANAILSNTVGGIRLKIGDVITDYDFPRESKVIFISAGDSNVNSAWKDDFILAHEIAHGTEHKYALPKYFKEGRADFKAFLLSGQTKSESHFEGVNRDVTNPDFKNLDTFFKTESNTANYYQVGSMWAHFLYLYWQKMGKPTGLEYSRLIGSLLSRVGNLAVTASPHEEKKDIFGKLSDPEVFDEAEARKTMQFIASVTLQWSIEQRLPKSVTQWMFQQWSSMGVRGPFKRYRQYEVDSDGNRYLYFLEREYDDVKMPDEWYTIYELP